MVFRGLTLLGLIVFSFGPVRAQGTGDPVKLLFDPYTSLRAHYAVIGQESEFQDNASRIGFSVGVGKDEGVRFLAHVELSIRLIENTFTVNADSRTTSGFIILNQSRDGQVFAPRLGFVGVSLGSYGVITIGKQWSTYYDITGWTDQFNVFGGTTSNTYVANTDGSIGTGRADQALVYRLKAGDLRFGLQLLSNNTTNNLFLDGYGGSVRYMVFPRTAIGLSYQRSLLADDVIDGTIGLEDHPEYISFGFRYTGERLYLSAVMARQTNGDLTIGRLNQLEAPSVVYDDAGLELAANYKWDNWKVLAGINREWSQVEGLPIDQDFHAESYILGLEYRPYRMAYFYSEFRFDQSVNSFGIKADNVFTLGLRVDLDHHAEKSFTF